MTEEKAAPPELGPDQKMELALPGLVKQLEAALKQIAGVEVGFGLVVFKVASGTKVNFASNVERGPLAEALVSLADNMKKKAEAEGQEPAKLDS